ncbi:MAG: hypothetical protein AAFQ24_14130 [Pseudomonadota bacterium]
MRVSKSTFVPGRFFLIPLKLSGFGIGQITEIHESVLSAYACLVFSKKLSSRNERFSVDDLTNRKITHQFVTPDLLWNGRWEALSIEPLLVTQDELIEVFGLCGPGLALKSSGDEVLGLCGPGLALKSSGDLDLPTMAQA